MGRRRGTLRGAYSSYRGPELRQEGKPSRAHFARATVQTLRLRHGTFLKGNGSSLPSIFSQVIGWT